MFVGKMEPIRWTSYMEECVEVLEQSPEFPSDKILSVLVRLQKIDDEAQGLLVRDAMSDTSGTPTFMFRKGLKERLNTIRSSTRSEFFANGKLGILPIPRSSNQV